MNPKISIIVPVYKVEPYLRKCIDSILNQTFKDFEFIIILDNPKNTNHINIINQYVNIDDRIRFYVNEKNMGSTLSLNKGLALT